MLRQALDMEYFSILSFDYLFISYCHEIIKELLVKILSVRIKISRDGIIYSVIFS